MRRILVLATVMTVMLLGAIVPAHATAMHASVLVTETDPTSWPGTLAGILDATIVDRGLDHSELDGVTDPLPPISLDQDDAQPALLTVAAEPSTLLLVGTGVAGMAGMVRRRLAGFRSRKEGRGRRGLQNDSRETAPWPW